MGRTTPAAAAVLLLLLPGVSAAQSVNMGATFHALEARARRITLTFPDVTVDVRRVEGNGMEGVLRDRRGTEGGRLQVPAGTRRVLWHRGDANTAVQEFALPEQATVGLDWVAHQLHTLHGDDRRAGEAQRADVAQDEGTWDGYVRRNRRAAARGPSAGQLAARLEAVETVFDDVVVRASLDRHERRPTGKRVDYSRFTATITDARTGSARGFVRWFDTAQVLTWKIEGGSQGVIMPDRLPEGWTFTPTMPWATVQAYQFATQATHTLEPSEPFGGGLARMFARPAASGPLAQLARVLAPVPSAAVAAAGVLGNAAVSDVLRMPRGLGLPWRVGAAARVNEPGCDNLHWLDGSIFRVCCDAHDRCYQTEGCGASSWWWPFSGTWSCQRCNIGAVYCFCTLANPRYCGGRVAYEHGESPDSGCTSVAGGFCSIECQTCQAY
jgi:hypothetical protein